MSGSLEQAATICFQQEQEVLEIHAGLAALKDRLMAIVPAVSLAGEPVREQIAMLVWGSSGEFDATSTNLVNLADRLHNIGVAIQAGQGF